MQDERDGDGYWMRRDDQFLSGVDLLEVDPGECTRSFRDCRRLRRVDRDKFVVAITLDPFAIDSRRTAEEDEIEVFELVIGNRRADHRLVADVRQRSGRFAGAVEQDQFPQPKRTLAQHRLDPLSDPPDPIY